MKLQDKKFYPWVVVGLLWVVALLNYMDRQMLSTMQENIANDISALKNAEAFGALMAIFLWVYGFCSPFSGAVADRMSRKWLIVGSLGVWSAVTYLMGYCSDFSQLMWLRGIMGISEALYIPSALSLLADLFTGKGRSLAIGLHMTGLYCGQALGGFGAMVATSWSWQTTFHWFGIIGVAYAIVLIFLLHEKEGRGKDVSKAATTAPESKEKSSKEKSSKEKSSKETVIQSFAVVFSNVAFWVILFFFASSSIPGWATKNWLPTLFKDNFASLNIGMEWAGPIATLTIAVSSFIGVMVGGPLSDKWVKKNVKGRIYTSAIGLSMMIPSLVLLAIPNSIVLSVLAGLLFGIGYGMFDANNMPILCQFVSSRQRAMAYGFMNSLGVIMGAVTTQVLGRLSDSLGLGKCFALMAGILLIAVALQLIVLKPKSDDKDDDDSAVTDKAYNEEAETIEA